MLWINWLLEATGVIQPLNILVTDGGGVLSLSYINGLRRSAESNFDISCTSNVFLYILSNDFGFNTIVVNGRFRSGGSGHYRRTLRFFVLQDYKKMGFGVTSPVATAMFISRRMKNIFLHMTIGFWRTLSRSSGR